MKSARITHEFVDAIPSDIAEGTLYISIPYATAIHLCCCGCGHEVVTPLTPTDWSVSFDGETVSLSPSIGNWSFKCESHYWISHNRVRWAGKWSRREIELGRARDRAAKMGTALLPEVEATAVSDPSPPTRRFPGWLSRWLNR